MPRFVSAFVLVLFVGLAVAPIDARRQAIDYRLLVETPFDINTQLRRVTRDGFTCVAVARPVVPLVPATISVLLAPAGGTAPEMVAVAARTDIIDDFHDAVSAMAARGFRVCGLSYTTVPQGRSRAYSPVVVMVHVAPGTPAPVYRLLRTRGFRDDWKQLEAAAADGFEIRDQFSRPVTATSDESELVFLLEKTASTRPARLDLAFAGNAFDLEKSANRLATDGFRVHAAWSANTRVSLLMAKPLTGAWDTAAEYKLDDPSRLRFSSLDGMLFAMLRHRDGFMGVYDRKAPRHEYTVTTGQFDDAPNRPNLIDRRKSLFLEKLDADAGRGYAPVAFTIERGTGAQHVATVTLSRQP